jgi:DNA-nicking Smr family endonuclease
MRRRPFSDQERQEWAAFTRAIGARPFPGRSPIQPPPPPVPAEVPVAVAAIAPSKPAARSLPARPAKAPVPAIAVDGPAPGLDGASWEKLRGGRMRPQRTLDLHGRTVQTAFLAFSSFIQSARQDGLRCIEIVTGRGVGEGGVLKRELPHWINLPHMRGHILAATHSSRTNTGSVRLLLRRVR